MSFKSTLTRITSRAGAKLVKNYPTIALAAGVAGFVGTVGLSIHASRKMDPIIRGHVSDIHHTAERFKKQNDPYTPEQFRKDQIAIWKFTIVETTKIFAPTVALGTFSIAALVSGQSVLNNRLGAMTLAYEGLSSVFKAYRGVVAEEIGEDREVELHLNAHRKAWDEGLVTHPDQAPSELPRDIYGLTFWFDSETCPMNYQNSDMLNANFLRDVENAMNRRLQQRGHLFLNDVYEALGMQDTPMGAQLGWINIPGEKESFVDFGFDRKINETVAGRIKEMSNDEHAYLLDLNVDGVIWNLL